MPEPDNPEIVPTPEAPVIPVPTPVPEMLVEPS